MQVPVSVSSQPRSSESSSPLHFILNFFVLCNVEDVEVVVFLVSTFLAEEVPRLVEFAVVVICSFVRMFLVTAVQHSVAKHFNFVGAQPPRAPLLRNKGVRAYGKSVLKIEVHADAPSGFANLSAVG